VNAGVIQRRSQKTRMVDTEYVPPTAINLLDKEKAVKQVAEYVRWFEETKIEDVPLVGGKNASLGEMYRELTNKGIKIPNGFAVTADAYWAGSEFGRNHERT
jgi:hypothetical protein